jgi:hypothetical protein
MMAGTNCFKEDYHVICSPLPSLQRDVSQELSDVESAGTPAACPPELDKNTFPAADSSESLT